MVIREGPFQDNTVLKHRAGCTPMRSHDTMLGLRFCSTSHGACATAFTRRELLGDASDSRGRHLEAEAGSTGLRAFPVSRRARQAWDPINDATSVTQRKGAQQDLPTSPGLAASPAGRRLSNHNSPRIQTPVPKRMKLNLSVFISSNTRKFFLVSVEIILCNFRT